MSKKGINVPIIPGLKPISTLKQINLIPTDFIAIFLRFNKALINVKTTLVRLVELNGVFNKIKN